MNKCLYCDKDVLNKYCNTLCQNKHRGLINEEKYKENPKLCLCCDTPLEYYKKNNKFCNNSCAATVNNSLSSVKRIGNPNLIGKEISPLYNILRQITDDDLIIIFDKSSSIKNFFYNINFNNGISKDIKDIANKRLEKIGLNIYSLLSKNKLSDKTKGYLFENRKNWQSARRNICKHARNIYKCSEKPKCCLVCKYENHIEVAHIKAVSDFDDNCLIS